MRIGPIIAAVIITLAICATILALVHVGDELHRAGGDTVRAENAEAQAKKDQDAKAKAEAAEDARQAAYRQGSLARLRAEWCRDCGEAR